MSLPRVSIIILAAGESSRLGQPKQLLMIGGKTLVHALCEEALASKASSVIAVTGSEADAVRKEIPARVTVAENSDWREGMSTSIIKGLQTVPEDSDGGLILLCDQPFVKRNLLNQMIESFQSYPSGVVACQYGTTVGVPVIFPRRLFPRLMNLKGDTGARAVLREAGRKIMTVPFPEGTIDIDTPADLKNLPGL